MTDNLRDDYGASGRPADREATKMATVIYALYAINLAIPGPFGLIGVVIAYLNRDAAASSWLQSHYQWEIRTFWISIAWLFIGLITIPIIIGIVILCLLWLWWAIRIVIGWAALAKERPIPNPRTWFF
jgi:uncharacterized membrane protein